MHFFLSGRGRVLSTDTRGGSQPDTAGFAIINAALGQAIVGAINTGPALFTNTGISVVKVAEPNTIELATEHICISACSLHSLRRSSSLISRRSSGLIAIVRADLKAIPRHRRITAPNQWSVGSYTIWSLTPSIRITVDIQMVTALFSMKLIHTQRNCRHVECAPLIVSMVQH